jgi:hypothetical protein
MRLGCSGFSLGGCDQPDPESKQHNNSQVIKEFFFLSIPLSLFNFLYQYSIRWISGFPSERDITWAIFTGVFNI